MKPIHSSLRKWLQTNENFQEQHLKLKQTILSDPKIKSLLNEHPYLSERIIDRNLSKLYEYQTQSKQCEHCASFKKCNNILQGYTPLLYVENDDIHLAYEKCHYRLTYEKFKEQKQLIDSLYMPKEILEATYDNIQFEQGRTQAMREMSEFVDAVAANPQQLPSRGLFFTGPFGVGKTYLLGALANKLKEYGISSMLIYMPEFVREIRNSIKDDSISEKVNYFKQADVLMLDDVGAETQSAWFRDEILGSILQFRMMEQLPVFFTSNYTMDQLEDQLAKTTRGEIEEVKAGRIMERIRQVSREVVITGKNRRYM